MEVLCVTIKVTFQSYMVKLLLVVVCEHTIPLVNPLFCNFSWDVYFIDGLILPVLVLIIIGLILSVNSEFGKLSV